MILVCFFKENKRENKQPFDTVIELISFRAVLKHVLKTPADKKKQANNINILVYKYIFCSLFS